MRFVFGDYVLDPDRRELTRGSEAIAIGPKVFDLLVHLVRNREHVVSKDDLLDGVWGGRSSIPRCASPVSIIGCRSANGRGLAWRVPAAARFRTRRHAPIFWCRPEFRVPAS